MAYFSNGTEGDYYEEKYCASCLHSMDETICPVMWIHFLYNSEAVAKDADPRLSSILDELIPRLEDGNNGKCNMRITKEKP